MNHLHTQLTVAAWREACRSIRLGDFLTQFSGLAREHIPHELCFVARFDFDRADLDVVAAAGASGEVALSHSRRDWNADEFERVMSWAMSGRVLARRPGDGDAEAPVLLPDGLRGHCMVGPLSGDTGPAGLVALLRNGAPYTDHHADALSELLEPIAAALEADARFRELHALREAAEADRARLLQRLGRTTDEHPIIGAQRGLRAVIERVDLIAPSDMPVLILGETGSGKEVIARALHTRSNRSGGPFIRVNCGAIPSELIDSELFGHERGSFTGAVATRRGWFERADGGTLFLDEIGELPVAVQARLLRVLQDGVIERVGGEQQLHLNVRVVTATHRDLPRMIAQGSFREDLWYRIAGFTIYIPPLRDRWADIPELVAHFAARAARRFGLHEHQPEPHEIEALRGYAWPGNVRELAAVVDRAVILGNGQRLDFATALGQAATDSKGTMAKELGPGSAPAAAHRTLDQAMADHIRATLRRCRGKIEGPAGAGELLGINPHTLRARMRKLGVRWDEFRRADATSGAAEADRD